ncbi:MAG TPA: hypothetical protein VGP76_32430 [Planctomycetaceae bacterium]|jgi:hypothetical protein|nr:hypothetical protein [Planctomycetaceae bacterium]
MTTTAWTIVWALLGSSALTSITVGGVLLLASRTREATLVALEVLGVVAEILSAF